MSSRTVTSVVILFALLLANRSLGAEDKFEWVPVEAKEDDGGGRSSAAAPVLPVVQTSLPKATANKAKFTRRHTIDLKKFNISNDGTHPVETAKGINQALQYAKEQRRNLIIFPKGTYLISEKDPIIFNLKDTIVDLNGATLQMNPSGQHGTAIALIAMGTENFRLTNGKMKGDLMTHDYGVEKPKKGGSAALRFKSGKNIEVDHMLFTECTGFCVTSSKGMDTLRGKGYRAVLEKNLESGALSDQGAKVADPGRCRTIEPLNVLASGKRDASLDGEFEFGYIFGYGSFASIFDRNYQACFYDKAMAFLEKNAYVQYKKNPIPKGAQFIHLEFNQPSAKAKTSGMVGSISNMRAPVDVHFHDNHVFNNSSLGFAFCGGQRWIMEDNMFEKNGGGAPPHYGIDFEDGWDLMQDVVFRNNRFKDNHRGDLVVCAGSELIFEGNVFEKTAHVWGRTHNYTFKNNHFTGGSAGFMSRTGIATIEDNLFRDCNVSVKYDAKGFNDGLNHEQGVAVATPAVVLRRNTFSNIAKFTGTYFNLEECGLDRVKFTAGKETCLVLLKGCDLKNSDLTYQADGPKVRFSLENCRGELTEKGPGIERKIDSR